MDEILNVFRGDAFTATSLTSYVARNPFNPQGIGELDVFETLPIRTTSLAVEDRDGKLVLIPTTPRGGPGTERVTEKRKARYFDVPRLFHADTIYAHELQNVREFIGDSGQAVTVLMQLQEEVARRLSGPTGLQASMEYTWEYHRLGAVQGILLDADGSTTLYNWFDEFGITPATEVPFSLSSGAVTATGTIRPACNAIKRAMMRAAKGAWTNATRVVALCGDTFFDGLTNHMDVKQTYLNWQEASELRKGQAFQSFTFADITWLNYRGSDDNTTIAIATDKAKFFPVGAPGVFQVAWAPGEAMQYVNTPGRPLYVQPILDTKRNQWFRNELTSFPLHICTRPEVLQSARAGS